jgi:hypothetical protein
VGQTCRSLDRKEEGGFCVSDFPTLPSWRGRLARGTKRHSCVVLSPRRTYAERLVQASGGGEAAIEPGDWWWTVPSRASVDLFKSQ